MIDEASAMLVMKNLENTLRLFCVSEIESDVPRVSGGRCYAASMFKLYRYPDVMKGMRFSLTINSDNNIYLHSQGNHYGNHEVALTINLADPQCFFAFNAYIEQLTINYHAALTSKTIPIIDAIITKIRDLKLDIRASIEKVNADGMGEIKVHMSHMQMRCIMTICAYCNPIQIIESYPESYDSSGCRYEPLYTQHEVRLECPTAFNQIIDAVKLAYETITDPDLYRFLSLRNLDKDYQYRMMLR